MARDATVLALFAYVDDLIAAVGRLRRERYAIETVFSPLPLPELQDILGGRTSPVRVAVLIGAVLGAASVVGLATYAHLSFSLITGGKPVLPWIAWVIVCFEGMVLGGVTAGALAWILAGRLPRSHPPRGYDAAFTRDRFGVLIACGVGEEESVRKLLEEEGAEEVRHVS